MLALLITFALAGQVAQDATVDQSPNVAESAAAPDNSAGATAAANQTSTNSAAAAPADQSAAAEQPSSSAGAVEEAQAQIPEAAKEPELAPERSLVVTAPKPSDLMQSLLKPPAAGQLTGVPITLGDAVREARSRQDQTQRAKAYWDLSATVGDYYLALLEATELQVLRQGVAAPSKLWDARQRDTATRIEVTRRSAQAAQLRLHQLVGRPITAAPPLPADAPHCGRYNAEYEEIFAARPNPAAKQLAELLPLRHEELRTQAQAIMDAVDTLNQVSQHRNPSTDGTELLHAQELLALKRRAFIATARDYNQEIAAYTELAAPAEVGADRLVAMMIRTSAPVGPSRWTRDNSVQQATAIDADGASDLQPVAQPEAPGGVAGQPQTFAAEKQAAASPDGQSPQSGNQREAWRPLQRLFNRDREHSILVNRPHLLRRALGNQ